MNCPVRAGPTWGPNGCMPRLAQGGSSAHAAPARALPAACGAYLRPCPRLPPPALPPAGLPAPGLPPSPASLGLVGLMRQRLS